MSELPGKAARFRPWIEALLVASALLAGAGTLLGFCAPLGWPFELAAHFRVQYFWGLSATAAAFVLLKDRRRAAAICGVLAIANLAVIAPIYVSRDTPVGRPLVRLMSQNLHWRNDDYERVVEVTRAMHPDVVLFLEVTPPWAEALAALESDFPYWKSAPSRGSGGIAIYSRLPLEDIEVTGLGVYMPTIIARLQLSDVRLTLIGVHPSSPGLPSQLTLRDRQLEALALKVQKEPQPLVVLGDLNMTSWTPSFDDLLDRTGLVDTRQGFGVQATWPWLPLPLRIPIDHCLVTSDLGVADRRVCPSVGSDHRGIVVDLTIATE